MDELLKLIGALPLPALVVFAAVVGLIFGVRYLGLWQGQHVPAAGSAASATVAAVIVDPTALNAATAAVEGFAVVVSESNIIARAHTVSTDRLADRIDGLTKKLDDLKDQVIRSAAKMK